MKRRRVLIITYYWVPAGGSGVQRWLKFVKYLPGFNWDPIVYTVEDGEMPVSDDSLLKDVPDGIEVIRRPIWEPYSFYKRFVGIGKNNRIGTGFISERKKNGILEKLSVWIRGNFFIPDARCFWIPPSVKFLSRWLKQNPVDVIISSGPPHSMHLIAMGLAKRTGLPWIADFRDPWTDIDYFDQLMPGYLARYVHNRLEREVLQNADKVIVVGKSMKKDFIRKTDKPVEVITNGFDTDDFEFSDSHSAERFIITHVGSMPRSRNPEKFWKCLAELVAEHEELARQLSIKLVGKVDHSVTDSIAIAGLGSFTEFVDYIPHEEVSRVLHESVLLLLVINDSPNAKGILTGKLFEYLAAKRTILCVGPVDGDAFDIIRDAGAGMCVGYEDILGMKTAVMKAFDSYREGVTLLRSSDINKYSRESLTRQLSALLDDLVPISRESSKS